MAWEFIFDEGECLSVSVNSKEGYERSVLLKTRRRYISSSEAAEVTAGVVRGGGWRERVVRVYAGVAQWMVVYRTVARSTKGAVGHVGLHEGGGEVVRKVSTIV